MSGIQEYFLHITASGLLVSVVLALLPKGTAQKAAKFCGSLVMILAVLSPLIRLREEDFAKGFLTTMGLDRATIQQQLQTDSSELLAQYIKEQCETYVWDRANAQGIDIQVEIRLEEDEAYPYPKASVVRGNISASQKQYLQQILEDEMGIPVLRQEWISP